jgi:hypothetical protein
LEWPSRSGATPARKAWKKAGSATLYFGPRMIATRLETEDTHGKTSNIFMASAYAPTGDAPADLRTQYADDMQKCIDACKPKEILVIYYTLTPTLPAALELSTTIRSSLVATRSVGRTEHRTRTEPAVS